MNCPVCKSRTLTASALGTSLSALGCENCGGHWINSFQFWKWMEDGRPGSAPSAQTPAPVIMTEPKGAKICPECAHILVRYRVDRTLPFTLDRCGNCGGLWFDRNEWELLRQRELLPQLHLVFSAAWQARLRREEHASQREASFRQRLGETYYLEVQRLQAWLDRHPHRAEILASLNDSRPEA